MFLRFDPFRELDRVVDQSLGQSRPAALPMDAYHHGDRLVVQFDLPGVDSTSIDLSVEQNVLTVSAERRFEPVEGATVVANERRHGTLTRTLYLGKTLDVENVEADYDSGVLTLTFPISEKAKPRKIEVGESKSRQIETTTA